jgi:hypothetical protein
MASSPLITGSAGSVVRREVRTFDKGERTRRESCGHLLLAAKKRGPATRIAGPQRTTRSNDERRRAENSSSSVGTTIDPIKGGISLAWRERSAMTRSLGRFVKKSRSDALESKANYGACFESARKASASSRARICELALITTGGLGAPAVVEGNIAY